MTEDQLGLTCVSPIPLPVPQSPLEDILPFARSKLSLKGPELQKRSWAWSGVSDGADQEGCDPALRYMGTRGLAPCPSQWLPFPPLSLRSLHRASTLALPSCLVASGGGTGSRAETWPGQVCREWACPWTPANKYLSRSCSWKRREQIKLLLLGSNSGPDLLPTGVQ